MKGENVACYLGALHYIVALAILLDSIIFMSGFSPFFITKLTPTAYHILLIYCITAGSLLFCHTKLASIWNKKAIEIIISRRQQRVYRRKHRFFQNPNPT
jgi:isoprenylcysteine carboxyl methyltransferase (ICMT) family protein YpbQ